MSAFGGEPYTVVQQITENHKKYKEGSLCLCVCVCVCVCVRACGGGKHGVTLLVISRLTSPSLS